MHSRCIDLRPWLLCTAVGCAAVAYVAGAVVAVPPWLESALTPRTFHATGAPDNPADRDAAGDAFHDPSLIWGTQDGSFAEHAGVPIGFVPLVWRKGFDPRPILIAA